MISSGLFLFTYKSTEFDLLGFILLLIASFSSGARWTLAQLVMQKSKLGLHNPIGEG
jgi:solute carrier family 35, member C2